MSANPISCDLLIEADHVLPMSADLPVIARGAVAVADGAILEVGTAADLRARYAPRERLSGGIALPGLVNTHGHLAMTLYRGLGDDLPLEQWLHEFVWPAEKAFTNPGNVRLGTELAIAEMLASGTTTFADMYFHQEVVGRVAAETGMRALLGQAVIGFPTPDCPDTGACFAKCRALTEEFAGHPHIGVSMALHAVYTLTPDQLAEGAEQAQRMGVPIQIHMSETAKEVEDCIATHGVTPPALMAQTGVLRAGTVGAHGVHLTPNDIELIRAAGAGVALNPESNLKLGSGLPDIAGLLAARIPLGLGTDGAASNNDLDLWDAVRLTALLPKGMGRDPTVVPAREAVRLATSGGADLLGLGDIVGTLEAGKRADICVVDVTAPHLTPLYHPYSHLAYAVRGSDVLHTIVEGRVVYRDRLHTTLDMGDVRLRASALARDIARHHDAATDHH